MAQSAVRRDARFLWISLLRKEVFPPYGNGSAAIRARRAEPAKRESMLPEASQRSLHSIDAREDQPVQNIAFISVVGRHSVLIGCASNQGIGCIGKSGARGVIFLYF